ncbi:MAG: penicillin-binding protein 2 [Gammaproteobacteria bacterium HGW-Gammaproteobacteria-4]|jgi:penicillin-binding protein 2|nr:MAG: penicillin-binding protein 2 [Gammaproteobacteria bacterium HGW-Gammaproteobacteria-4]
MNGLGGGGRALRDAFTEAALFRRRAALGFIIVALATLLLAAWYFRLQVIHHAIYSTRSEANRIKARPIAPARGLIYDRAGRLLADNVPAYRLELVPEQVADIPATLSALSEVIALGSEDRQRFEAARQASRRFLPVPLKLRLSEAEVARFAVNRYRFPGVDVTPYLTRRYPYGDLFAHVVGYVGRRDADDLKSLDDSRYAALSHSGKSGIERFYELRLRGEIGYEEVEQNARGRDLRVIRRTPAKPGNDLYLSLDARLQAATTAAFGEHHGAAVVLDPRNGEVLAMVSLPSFDPNPFVGGIAYADYAALNASPSRPLFNRVLFGGYEPGSTIKPLLALIGLELGLRTPSDTVLSTGAFKLPGQDREYRDWKRGGHGRIDLRESLAQSVNTYYYTLANELGIDRISAQMARFGFGAPTGIDLLGEVSGILPSREWKRNARGQPWFPGETVIIGIGQGYWVTTPLQLAQGVSIIASGGVKYRPHLLRATRAGFASEMLTEPLPAAERVVADAANLAAVRDGMVAVMHSPTGSGRAAAVGAPYRIAGKTGTAQRVTRVGDTAIKLEDLPFNLRHRALFVAFAPADAPRIALALVVESGGSGSGAAAPIARKILDAWLLDEGRQQ